jgi:hypothetical protein
LRFIVSCKKEKRKICDAGSVQAVSWISIVLMPIWIQIPILMPIQIRIRIGIKRMPIHMRIYRKFFSACWKIGEKIVLFFSAMPVFSVFLFHKLRRDFIYCYILDSILKFSGKNTKCIGLELIPIGIRQNYADPTRSGSRCTTLDTGTPCYEIDFLPRCGTREGSRGTAPSWPAATGAP